MGNSNHPNGETGKSSCWELGPIDTFKFILWNFEYFHAVKVTNVYNQHHHSEVCSSIIKLLCHLEERFVYSVAVAEFSRTLLRNKLTRICHTVASK